MEKEKTKCVYVPPKIEVHATAPCHPLASSPLNGRHIRGDVDSGSDGFAIHMRGAADTGGTSGGGGNAPEDGFAVHIRGNADYWD